MEIPVNKTKGDKCFNIVNYSLLFLIAVISLYPLIFVLSASVSNPQLVIQGKVWLLPRELTYTAYKAVLTDSTILTGYKNSIIYTVVGTLVNIVMTTAGAYPLSKKDFYGRNVITIFFTITMFFNGGLIPSYLLIKSLHLYNNFWVMILPGAVSMWNLIIMRNFFQQSIPNELTEAAYVDGCTNVGTLIRVVLPLSKAILAVMVIFYGVGNWNAYFNAMIYLSKAEKYPLQLVLREILLKNEMSSINDSLGGGIAEQQLLSESIKYAVIVFASLPVLLLYPVLQKHFVNGIMIGAIKG